VTSLPQDFDEPVYVVVAVDYARSMERSDFNAVIDYPGVREHPALVKLVYGFSIYTKGISNNYSESLKTSRIVSAVFGVIATILVALFDPFAGGLMGIHALVVKYSSQAYLEAIPLAFTTFSILAFLRSNKDKRDTWFWLSAFALGASTAGKFTYTPVLVIVLAYLAFFEKKIPFRWMAVFSVVAVAAFFALNVTLWHHPFERIMEALEYHANYQRGVHVAEVNYPWYQPFIWLFVSTPGDWHGGIFLYDIDPFIAVFAFAGISREWKDRRWLVIWLVSGIIFLLLWGTKWPQYVLTIVPAICMMAAESMRRFYKWFTHLSYYKTV
jgi:4-amino-4-deoxy-L-arabinose transferase-like glycosyltransferase